ncbi:MAG: CHRD domain-containing protein, partial [Woeseiaceae bacterium]|nr:CHRD domain-containing protein [Woeseiaceae bacterium]
SRATLLAVIMGMVSFGVSAGEMNVTLGGDQEVPPVTTMASGEAQFMVKDDMSLSGSVKTQGIKATAAHIHTGAAGKNGPVAITLTMKGDNEWFVPADTKLTAAQMKEFNAGGMYVNVHSAAHTDGEIRAQLK